MWETCTTPLSSSPHLLGGQAGGIRKCIWAPPLQQTRSFTVDIRAKPEYHKFLIGKGGGKIRKVRDSTGARIIFPTAEDKDQDLITIIGKEDAVREAQKELEALIQNLVRPAGPRPSVCPALPRGGATSFPLLRAAGQCG